MSGSDLQKSISTWLSGWRVASSDVVKAVVDWDLTWKKNKSITLLENKKVYWKTINSVTSVFSIKQEPNQCRLGVVAEGGDGSRRRGHRDGRRRFVKRKNASIATRWSRDKQVELDSFLQPRKERYVLWRICKSLEKSVHNKNLKL